MLDLALCLETSVLCNSSYQFAQCVHQINCFVVFWFPLSALLGDWHVFAISHFCGVEMVLSKITVSSNSLAMRM